MIERDAPLTVTLDLELPDNRIFEAEMELIEAELAELMRQLFQSGTDEE